MSHRPALQKEITSLLESIAFRGEVRFEEPLAGHTTFRIGGPAAAMLSPAGPEETVALVVALRRRGLPYRVIGNGSNLLVSDRGVRAAVIKTRPALDRLAAADNLIEAGAGCLLSRLCRFAAKSGLSGLEFLAGIPGTVGGAVVMNAGWGGKSTGEAVESVSFLDPSGRVRRRKASRCGFGYRASRFRKSGEIVLSAVFRGRSDDPGKISGRMTGILAERKASFPGSLPGAGSVFKNPPGDFAGRLIEKAGLKGKRIGGAGISPRHANFIVNRGGAGSEDVLRLIELARERVAADFGKRLELEIEYWPPGGGRGSRNVPTGKNK